MASTAQQAADHESAPRIRLLPLTRRLAGALLLPVGAAFLLDRLFGLTPWLTLAAMIICIPLATVLVSKAALRDLERVIALVAPPAHEADEHQAEQDSPLTVVPETGDGVHAGSPISDAGAGPADHRLT